MINFKYWKVDPRAKIGTSICCDHPLVIQEGWIKMQACPHCGSREFLREIPPARSSTELTDLFQYYRCRDCDETFREFALDVFFQRIYTSTGIWYIGFAMFILIVLIGVKCIFSLDSDLSCVTLFETGISRFTGLL